MSTRRILKTYSAQPTVEGAGVHLKRAFGYAQVPEFDPFLMMDDFHSSKFSDYSAGFPWHPHRGIETITYILEGIVEHGDSMGNKGIIGAGDVQWMTAGSGIIHQEMPRESPTGTMWGLQFWANLPAAQKMMPPRYRDVKAADIPEVVVSTSITVKVICGLIEGVRGPVRDIITDPELLDVSLAPGATFIHPVKPGHTAIVYILQGKAIFEEGLKGRNEVAQREQVILYDREGDQVVVSSADKPVRFLFISGKPLGEPIAWHGPVVMNTQEELRQAFEEYQSGTFIK